MDIPTVIPVLALLLPVVDRLLTRTAEKLPIEILKSEAELEKILSERCPDEAEVLR
jgi:hypothetical protein